MTEQLPLYALRTAGPDAYQLAKFSMPDFNVKATYNLTRKGIGWTCDCPANGRSVVLKPCKHKRMMPLMLGAVNLPRFFEPITGRWLEVGEVAPGLPTADDVASEASSRQSEAEPASEPPIELPMPTTIPLTKPTTGSIRRR